MFSTRSMSCGGNSIEWRFCGSFFFTFEHCKVYRMEVFAHLVVMNYFNFPKLEISIGSQIFKSLKMTFSLTVCSLFFKAVLLVMHLCIILYHLRFIFVQLGFNSDVSSLHKQSEMSPLSSFFFFFLNPPTPSFSRECALGRVPLLCIKSSKLVMFPPTL